MWGFSHLHPSLTSMLTSAVSTLLCSMVFCSFLSFLFRESEIIRKAGQNALRGAESLTFGCVSHPVIPVHFWAPGTFFRIRPPGREHGRAGIPHAETTGPLCLTEGQPGGAGKSIFNFKVFTWLPFSSNFIK